jgi:hypothetical protein
MVANSANQGIPEQQGPDPANLPSAQVSWDGVMENRLWQRYLSEADRTARNPAPNENEASALAAEDRVDIWNTANWISLHSRSLFANLRKNADSAAVNNSTVLVNDADFVVALPTAGTFAWRQISFYDCVAAADFKCTYTFPAGTTQRWGVMALGNVGAANPGDVFVPTVTASGTTVFIGGVGAGTVVWGVFEGEVTMGGTAGNMQFQYAQQVADPSNLIHRARSRLQVWRVS